MVGGVVVIGRLKKVCRFKGAGSSMPGASMPRQHAHVAQPASEGGTNHRCNRADPAQPADLCVVQVNILLVAVAQRQPGSKQEKKEVAAVDEPYVAPHAQWHVWSHPANMKAAAQQCCNTLQVVPSTAPTGVSFHRPSGAQEARFKRTESRRRLRPPRSPAGRLGGRAARPLDSPPPARPPGAGPTRLDPSLQVGCTNQGHNEGREVGGSRRRAGSGGGGGREGILQRRAPCAQLP